MNEKYEENIFNYDIAGGFHHWTTVHLAANSSKYELLTEILSTGTESIFERNLDQKMPKHCAKGNLLIAKLI